ncbi:ATP-dependent zinc metalloprotease FTSH 4 [Phytophthora fragariae]|uniref:ATP-dependent zinc metalloprotease FTSH 4 n=1 Tax=Phytophthora fragariae TaxID=53985 RepID=A0A6G0LV94_9STRA|nr:ATP-dependent zinc metalloprotease FTSH 4 [Phytophthora fragariae]KAE9340888.1 ATP-dependent zinc metalloprotease FTSH 4 [Phytophthora fragariae]
MLVMRPRLQLLQRAAARAHSLSPPLTLANNPLALAAVRPPPPAVGAKRSLFNMTGRGKLKQLKSLEQAANSSPEDPYAQLRFLQELNRNNYPALVVRRVEENRFALDDAGQKEYIKALVKTGRLDTVDLPQLANADAGRQFSGLAAAGAGPAVARNGQGQSAHDPMYVSMVEGSFKSNMWKTLRTLGVAFLVVSALGAMLDEKVGKIGSASKVMGPTGSDKRFSDVKGATEAKQELEEIVQFLRDPARFTRLGGNLPKGVLLTGPPGTGKTLLARAIAGEAGVPFFYSSGSEFEEMYVGVGARRVRDLFESAKRKAPCIIFIDEIDAIGGTRKLKEQQAMKMTLNQLLVEMDGFDQNKGIIVIGATNFPDVLDNALIRPGRFDRHVTVDLPDVAGRKEILEFYAGKIPLCEDVDLDVLARATPGMSGAELSNLVNEAALRASMKSADVVDMDAFEYAKDKILMGAERKSALITPESAKLTAYHEGGHALVAINTPGAHPVYKATIMPRGQALGMVSQLPEGDQTSISRKQLLARLDVCMGGRVAEELTFGEEEITGGASSDIQQATNVARTMVTKYGMSEDVGLVFHDLRGNDTSATTRKTIDDEVKKLCDASYKRAKDILVSKHADLEKLAQALLEYETLSGAEIDKILKGEPLDRKPIK